MNETDTQIRLRGAMELLKTAREEAAAARSEVLATTQRLKVCKEKYEYWFLKNEKEEMERRASTYRHATN